MPDRSSWVDAVVRLRQPMEPIETDVVPSLQPLADVRAWIFDVYGTLVISGSGDVGSADPEEHDNNLADALVAVGIQPQPDRRPTTAQLHRQIAEMNGQRRSESCPKPEVDIVEAWRRTLADQQLEPSTESVARLAAEYEARANPTWQMPGAADLVRHLRSSGFSLGIVSNAQIFTPCLVEQLLQPPNLAEGGFDLDLCVFSNRFRQAKPGPRLFDVLRGGLARRGILPHQAVYVGNDMLNDVWAASQAGLRTAWFAGDARSCRPRQDDPRCRSLKPDVVLTTLMQLLQCIEMK